MGRLKITQEEFNSRVKKRFPEENFEIVIYDSIGKPLEIRCLQCQTIIKVNRASNFLCKNKVYGCVHCKGLHIKRTQQINNLLKEYNLIDDSEVRNTHKVYTLECKKCGHIRKTVLNNFIQHPDCGCKTGYFRRTKEQFEKEFLEYTNHEYELLEDFKGMLSKILIKHKKCGFIFKMRPNDLFYRGTGKCPRCYKRESSNCRYITSLLENSGIAFEKEKRLGDTRQFFDFYLNDFNTAIEYNGEQHYKFSSLFHQNEENFKIQLERDIKKRQWAEAHNIKLIIIPYTKTRVEIKEIISSIVSESSTTKVGEVSEKGVLPTREDDIVYSSMKIEAKDK